MRTTRSIADCSSACRSALSGASHDFTPSSVLRSSSPSFAFPARVSRRTRARASAGSTVVSISPCVSSARSMRLICPESRSSFARSCSTSTMPFAISYSSRALPSETPQPRNELSRTPRRRVMMRLKWRMRAIRSSGMYLTIVRYLSRARFFLRGLARPRQRARTSRMTVACARVSLL
jgi:hypothetical protein